MNATKNKKYDTIVGTYFSVIIIENLDSRSLSLRSVQVLLQALISFTVSSSFTPFRNYPWRIGRI